MPSEQECRDILGVDREATDDEIMAARRRLARVAHPDSGGDHLRMVAVNEACRILLASRRQREEPPAEQSQKPQGKSESRHGTADDRVRIGFRDAPSFVINSLPVDAFETLVVAASNLGEIVDEDPPYLMEVLVRDPGPLWCRFELFPDAGSTTVILSCDIESGYRLYSVEEIRDMWISTINATTSSR